MNISILLFIAILFISLVITMVGLGGGLIFSPLFVILGITLASNLAVGFIAGMVIARLLRWEKLSVYQQYWQATFLKDYREA